MAYWRFRHRYHYNFIAIGLIAAGLSAYAIFRIFFSHAASINADLNGDGAVNIIDLSILASNYGKSFTTFSQGDLNVDGHVNILDFSLLASNWGQTPIGQLPSTFVLDPQRLLATKQHLSEAQYQSAYMALITAANSHLADKPGSVMDKTQVPPSGDKHDYYSLSPYYWPDPSKPNGLPYIPKDGQINPEYYGVSDGTEFGKMETAVNALTQAYYFSNQPQYATKAEQLLNTWYINPATKMNPNLDNTAVIKGIGPTAFGIIEMSSLYQIIDDVKIMQTSPAWTASDQTSFRQWCSAYLTWLKTSSAGQKESAQPSNHGTWYNSQIASLAEFTGDHNTVIQAINNARALIGSQIRPDGTEPLELARTRPWNYAVFNLRGLIALAEVAQREQLNLLGYTAPSGGSIHRALDYLAPYGNGSKSWATIYPKDLDNTPAFRYHLMTPLFRQAATAYNDPKYEVDADESQTTHLSTDFSRLVY